MLNYEFPPIGGGAGQAHLNILHQFANHPEVQIDVLTCAVGRGIEIEKFSSNINIHRIGIRKKNLHYWLKIEVIEWLFRAGKYHKQLIKNNNYDLAHAFFGFPTGYLPYKTADKLPYIISLRGSDVPGYNIRLGIDYILLAGLFRRIWTKAKAVVANSQGLAHLGNRFMPEMNIGIITNGIDMGRFHPARSKKLGSPVKLITVCRLISRKRIDLLINAIKLCRDNGYNVELNIAGHGNLQNELEKLAAELNISDYINFLGRIESKRMPEIYRENDIFIMSSAHEGMSNAMLEAMASGLPIITTYCEGVDELIDGNGAITPAEPLSIANAIEDIIDDSESFETMKELSVKQAAKFSWNTAAKNYIQLYESVINE